MPKLLALLLVALSTTACTTTQDEWGGYTENQAKEILALPDVRETVINTTPRTVDQEPIAAIYPTEQELEDADLLKKTIQGQEAWEYNDKLNAFCLYVWEDPETEEYFAQSSQCVAD